MQIQAIQTPQHKRSSLAAAILFALTAYNAQAATFTATDRDSLATAINNANGNSEADIIQITSDITISEAAGFLPLLNSDILIEGNGNRLIGENQRQLFVRSGKITIQNLTFSNGTAKGGNGSGGGAGMGGALFVYDGNVTLENTTFSNNTAQGGRRATGGGGGMGGDGNFGGGGLANSSFGRSGGSYLNQVGAASGQDGGFGSGGGQRGNGGFGGGGGFSNFGRGGDGGFGGGGGGEGNQIVGDPSNGGNGGFGAGGGYGGTKGINGYGAGTGREGAGFGGAVFARAGTLTINNSTFSGNTATRGGSTALAKGGAIFAMDQTRITAHNALSASNQAMPTVAATVTGCGNTFENNTAADANSNPTADTDNADTLGASLSTLAAACTVAEADVAISLTPDTAGPYRSGQTITYTLVASNSGPVAATNAVISDTSTNLTINNISSANCTDLPCTLATLANGASETITVTATIQAAGDFDYTATINATEPDPVSSNNTDNTSNGGTAVLAAGAGNSESIPTLSHWGLLLLSSVLGVFGYRRKISVD